jgi:hypothetical protein
MALAQLKCRSRVPQIVEADTRQVSVVKDWIEFTS